MNAGGQPLIGFEATALELRERSGVSHYTAQLLHSLVAQGSRWRFALLSSRAPACSIPENVLVPEGWRFPNRSLWIQLALPRIVARLRPQASTGAVFLGISAHVAGQAKSASQQPTSQKYAYTMTRIAAFGGGALGPHPARDPV